MLSITFSLFLIGTGIWNTMLNKYASITLISLLP